MAEQPRKIKKYRKPLNLNIGMLIFGAIFIYVIICVILYFQTDHIVRYEVTDHWLPIIFTVECQSAQRRL